MIRIQSRRGVHDVRAADSAKSRRYPAVVLLLIAALLVSNTNRRVAADTPNTVLQWNRVAEDAVVRSGAFQNEGLIYMAYVSAAVYNAVVAIAGGYEPYGPGVVAPAGASTDAAIVEAAYRTLINNFPGQSGILDPLYKEALAAVPDGQSKTDGQLVGLAAATQVINMRANDGRQTPIGVSSAFPTKPPGPGVWRLTPPAFALAQTPWVAHVTPFLLQAPDQFLPDPPPALASSEWTEGFEKIQVLGRNTGARTLEQTAAALFWTANVIRQYNRLLRDVALGEHLSLLESARLQALVNMIAADAQISVMHAKYHFLFWRPVTAIDPTTVKPLPGDGFGPTPGYDDDNLATVEEVGWRPLIATPNHPEYPAAHGSITSAIAEVFSTFLGTRHFHLTIYGFDPGGGAGNLNAARTFTSPNELRNEIIDARLWAGVHYHFSSVAGVVLGRQVAKYGLSVAFRPAAP